MSAPPPRAESGRGTGTGRARCFVALALGSEIGEEVCARVVAVLGAGEAERNFRLPRPDGLHQTLFFLGSVERERLYRVEMELGSALAGKRAPRLLLARTGAFPSRTRARVLWIGLEERSVPGSLAAVRAAVLGALARSGFDTHAEERDPFRPHVTVARPRERRTHVPPGFFELELALAWDPTEVTLFESVLGDGPARYEPLARIPLAAD